MKKLLILAFMLAIGMGLAVFGCSKKNPTTIQDTSVDDNTAVSNVVTVSAYATVDNYGDDGTAGFAKDGATKSDTFPNYVRWRRRITGISKSVSIAYDSNQTFATVTISSDYTGRIVVDNTNDSLRDTISRAISDHGVRYVWLKKINNHWRLWGASPLEIATAGAANGVIIDSVVVHATTGERPDVTFLGTLYGQTLRREQMPIFAPHAVVTATVYTRTSAGADSTWAFLHRRIHPFGALPNHIREPLYRESQLVFTKTWTLDADTIQAFPAVRHACLDVILGSTLFGNSSAEYSARMWTVPYIVKAVTDTMP